MVDRVESIPAKGLGWPCGPEERPLMCGVKHYAGSPRHTPKRHQSDTLERKHRAHGPASEGE